MRRRTIGLMVALALTAAACSGADEPADTDVASESAPTDTAVPAETSTPVAAAEPTDATTAGSCDVASLPLFAADTLTVATGEPVFEPWMVDDDPTNGQGFESAMVYALAEEMGFSDDQVTWVRTGFDQAIAPGAKDYDFNVQQYSISEDRDEVVDFSDGYYEVEQALVAAEDAEIASATSVTELTSSQLGAAIGTTSLDYIEQVIQPESQPQVFDDNAAAKAAFDAGQIDGLVFDLPTAYFVTAVEMPDASIVGVLPRQGESEELGLLFEDGSELVSCVNQALRTLTDDGTIEELENEWLNQGGDIPTLS